MMEETLKSWIEESRRIVFFGGAGVSTESGIPDFRSPDGLYHQQYDVPPETVLSHDFFLHRPEVFFKFYRERMLCPQAKPNAAHLALAKLEREGKLTAVITQNIDGLHQMAGSKKVLELHGSVLRNHCMRCGRAFDLSAVAEGEGVPHCPCGGIIKPDVVLYGEPLDSEVLDESVEAIQNCDLLIVGGTSLAVWPAAGLINYRRSARLVVINKTPTPADEKADLVLHGSIGQILGEICEINISK